MNLASNRDILTKTKVENHTTYNKKKLCIVQYIIYRTKKLFSKSFVLDRDYVPSY
jgi:hypothetical protein